MASTQEKFGPAVAVPPTALPTTTGRDAALIGILAGTAEAVAEGAVLGQALAGVLAGVEEALHVSCPPARRGAG